MDQIPIDNNHIDLTAPATDPNELMRNLYSTLIKTNKISDLPNTFEDFDSQLKQNPELANSLYNTIKNKNVISDLPNNFNDFSSQLGLNVKKKDFNIQDTLPPSLQDISKENQTQVAQESQGSLEQQPSTSQSTGQTSVSPSNDLTPFKIGLDRQLISNQITNAKQYALQVNSNPKVIQGLDLADVMTKMMPIPQVSPDIQKAVDLTNNDYKQHGLLTPSELQNDIYTKSDDELQQIAKQHDNAIVKNEYGNWTLHPDVLTQYNKKVADNYHVSTNGEDTYDPQGSIFKSFAKGLDQSYAGALTTMAQASDYIGDLFGIQKGTFFKEAAKSWTDYANSIKSNPDDPVDNLARGVGQLPVFVAEMLAVPEVKIAKLFGVDAVVGKMGTIMGMEGFFNGYSNETTQPYRNYEAWRQAGIGFITGKLFEDLGYSANVIGDVLGSAAKNESLGKAASAALNGAIFAGGTAYQQYATTGQINTADIWSAAGFGTFLGAGAFGKSLVKEYGDALSRQVQAKITSDFMINSHESFVQVANMKLTPEDVTKLRDQSNQIGEEASNTADINKKNELLITKQGIDNVLSMNAGLKYAQIYSSDWIKAIKSSDVYDEAQKKFMIDKINQVVQDNPIFDTEIKAKEEELSQKSIVNATETTPEQVQNKPIEADNTISSVLPIDKNTGKEFRHAMFDPATGDILEPKLNLEKDSEGRHRLFSPELSDKYERGALYQVSVDKNGVIEAHTQDGKRIDDDPKLRVLLDSRIEKPVGQSNSDIVNIKQEVNDILISPKGNKVKIELLNYPDNNVDKYRLLLNGHPERTFTNQIDADKAVKTLRDTYTKKGYSKEQPMIAKTDEAKITYNQPNIQEDGTQTEIGKRGTLQGTGTESTQQGIGSLDRTQEVRSEENVTSSPSREITPEEKIKDAQDRAATAIANIAEGLGITKGIIGGKKVDIGKEFGDLISAMVDLGAENFKVMMKNLDRMINDHFKSPTERQRIRDYVKDNQSNFEKIYEENSKQRGFEKRTLAREDIPDEVKGRILAGDLSDYIPFKHEDLLDAAINFVLKRGLDDACTDFENGRGYNELSGAKIGQILYTKLSELSTNAATVEAKNKYADRAVDIFNKNAERSTNAAQILNSFKYFADIKDPYIFRRFVDQQLKKGGEKPLTNKEAGELMDMHKKMMSLPEGAPRMKAMFDMVKWRAVRTDLKWGDLIMSEWYANILSGYTTHLTNFAANLANTGAEFVTSMLTDPRKIPYLLAGMGQGLASGAFETANILKTGYTPIHDVKMVKGINPFELINSKNPPKLPLPFGKKLYLSSDNPLMWPLMALKIPTRVLLATDSFSFHMLREMRAQEYAYRELVGNPLKGSAWTKSMAQVTKDVNEKIFKTKEQTAQFSQQAQDEGFKKGSFDYRRRVWELMEMNRPAQMKEDNNNFAAHGTFNYKPEGTMGSLTARVQELTNDIKALKYIVPFTSILTNIVNNYLDFSPYGYKRAISGGVGKGFLADDSAFKRNYTPEERTREFVKATIGTLALTYMYHKVFGDPDPDVEITANGTNDYYQNLQFKPTTKGWQKYSIRVGDTWYTYANTPLALPFTMLGSLSDAIKYNNATINSKEWNTKVQLMLFGTMNYFTNQTFLQGLTQGVSILSDAKVQTAINSLQNLSKNITKSFFIPNLYTQVARTVQNSMQTQMKDTKVQYPEGMPGGIKAVGETLLNNIIMDIPVLRDKLNNKYDVFGDPVVADPSKYIDSPSDRRPTAYGDAVVKNQAWIGKLNRGEMTFDTNTGQQRFLTDDEFTQLGVRRGQLIKQGIIGNQELIDKMAPDDARQYMKKMYEGATREAKSELMLGPVTLGMDQVKKQLPEVFDMLKKYNGAKLPDFPHSLWDYDPEHKEDWIPKAQYDEIVKAIPLKYAQNIKDELGTDASAWDNLKQDTWLDKGVTKNALDFQLERIWSNTVSDIKKEVTDKYIDNKESTQK